MVYLVVENKIVTQILPGDLPPELLPKSSIPYDGDIPRGSILIWDGTQLSVDLSDDKEDAINEIKDRFKTTVSQGYVCSNNIKMQCDFVDISKIRGGIILYKQANKDNIIIKDYNNEMIIVPIEEAERMLVEISAYYMNLWMRKGVLELLIRQAESYDELQQYTWDIEFTDEILSKINLSLSDIQFDFTKGVL